MSTSREPAFRVGSPYLPALGTQQTCSPTASAPKLNGLGVDYGRSRGYAV
jgi:hypothetical protein